MQVTVLYFAAARERSGTSREAIAWPVEHGTVQELMQLLLARHPSLVSLAPHLRVAVNQELAEPDAAVPDNAEIALLPPVSGGAGGRFDVVARPLSLEEVVAAVAHPGAGACATFSGWVRETTRGRTVQSLEYESYLPMARRVLEEVGAEARRRWPGVEVAIVHRVGVLLPGELAVVVAASAPHRREAFAACAFTIDEVKARAPIWKRERFADGEVWVGVEPGGADGCSTVPERLGSPPDDAQGEHQHPASKK